MEIHSENILQLLNSLNKSHDILDEMGFEEERDIIQLMRRRYYKMYFQLSNQETSLLD